MKHLQCLFCTEFLSLGGNCEVQSQPLPSGFIIYLFFLYSLPKNIPKHLFFCIFEIRDNPKNFNYDFHSGRRRMFGEVAAKVADRFGLSEFKSLEPKRNLGDSLEASGNFAFYASRPNYRRRFPTLIFFNITFSVTFVVKF